MLRGVLVRRAPSSSSARPPLLHAHRRSMSIAPAEASVTTAAIQASSVAASSSSPRRHARASRSSSSASSLPSAPAAAAPSRSSSSRSTSYPGLVGLFSVYKPRGVTSRDVVNAAAALLSAGPAKADGSAGPVPSQRQRLKMGHGGTLDKAAEGVVILAAAAGTKLLAACLSGPKAYEAAALLGVDSDSHDTDEGAAISSQSDCAHVTRAALESFLTDNYAARGGSVVQTPPLYSALKQDGQRLSDRARSGHADEVDLGSKARTVQVYSIELLSFAPPHLSLRCTVGGGFYVRSLIRDIGRHFACGAVMTALVRTEQHGFSSQSEHCIDMSDEKLYCRKESSNNNKNRSTALSNQPPSALAAVLAAAGPSPRLPSSRPSNLLPFTKENVMRVLAVPLDHRRQVRTEADEAAAEPAAPDSSARLSSSGLPARVIAAAAAAIAGASLAVAADAADSAAGASASSSSSSSSAPSSPASPASLAESILAFWFFAPEDPQHGSPRMAWFKKDPTFDSQIRAQFGPLIDSALSGGLREWRAGPSSSPQTRLALILLLDQFTRNTFRGSPRSFAGDAQALSIARELVADGSDRALGPAQRSFVYLPFEHAESMAEQHESVRLCTQLRDEMPAGSRFGAELVAYAEQHRDIVTRFGRFPHRNAVLGRESTAEEIEFLKQPGSSF